MKEVLLNEHLLLVGLSQDELGSFLDSSAYAARFGLLWHFTCAA